MTSEQSSQGKICLVTGATSGIGKVTATALAAQEAEVVIVGRNAQKTQATAQQIRAETGNDLVHFLLADFSDLGQVRDLAAAFKKQFSRLDVLVNNAGAYFNRRERLPMASKRPSLLIIWRHSCSRIYFLKPYKTARQLV
jgi:NAD(P)-dependent dehydrogenase (short-subunit alcohol dehydrogenase family)